MSYTWSYSAINLFKQCPKKYHHLKILKDIVEPQSEALLFGNRVQKAVEFVRDCMKWRPDWCQDLPLDCEVGFGGNYGEIK